MHSKYMGRRFKDQLGWDTGGKLARILYDKVIHPWVKAFRGITGRASRICQ